MACTIGTVRRGERRSLVSASQAFKVAMTR